MKFPSMKDVAAEFRVINRMVSGECDVRLQVYPDGEWAVHWGDSSYDQDHRGYWGAGSVPGNSKRLDTLALARDLLEQAKEQHAQDKASEGLGPASIGGSVNEPEYEGMR